MNFNLTAVLDKEIDAGPLKINAADIDLPDAVQEAVDLLNDCLFAVFIFYVLGSVFSGVAFLLSIATLALAMRKTSNQKPIILVNMINACLGALTLMIGSSIITAIANKGATKINDAGDAVGISAIPGHKLIILSWVAFGLMGATLLFWTLTCCLPRKAQWDDPHTNNEKAFRPSLSSDHGMLRGFFSRNR